MAQDEQARLQAVPAHPGDVVFSVEPIDTLDGLEREWRRLEVEAAPSFFLSWQWIGTLLEMVPPSAMPRVLRGTADGRTVALAVLGDAQIRRHHIVRARRWVLNATGDPRLDCIFPEHNGLLADPDVGWEGLIEAFCATTGVDEISFPGIATPPPAALVEERGLLREERPESSFAVDLGTLSASGGDITAILSPNARSQLRRALRKLDPVTIEAASDEQQALDFFRMLKELHIPWWEQRGLPHAFVHPFFERFHERLIERGFAEGAVELLRVQSGDRTLGVLYNFRRGNRIYAYQSGFVHPRAHERPGVIAHALAIKKAWQDGAEIYDFMAGENRLKRSFGNRTETLSWTVVQKPRLRFRIEHRALGGSRSAKKKANTGHEFA
ncbi:MULTISPECIES: GNAT family N-acetyltransferase [Mycobacteriaceae]|uniref:BioF2-like acetyltransferase domain-containing protein n=1 Tax=Mycolicibacterium neoaurum VKM Ac-1815D TaxID=700508 RepID=V5XJS9_MYCNE|nr:MULTISPECIES: GNAT family N-acetyltransferase [Mycobacteriaceae]AMO07692.1 cellulose biosynthesis protein CelD [Mycolicibacterium neoaurum]AXK73913.1 GNAT family N-acetyltransferase [Mycolicibacterium neoaurum]KUM06317.1 cellulose biosynthesis protein CelD [Mycolicibacterium neoaurum]